MTTEQPVIDKSSWGAGPWQDEPDRVDFIASGFACLALRHPEYGHFCGYVGVPREHPAYGKGYDDVSVEFHGGLTYSRGCEGLVCHVPAPGMPDDVWWLGGDFGHAFDLMPGFVARERSIARMARERGDLRTAEIFERGAELHGFGPETAYRDLPYVRSQIAQLAEQLREAARA